MNSRNDVLVALAWLPSKRCVEYREKNAVFFFISLLRPLSRYVGLSTLLLGRMSFRITFVLIIFLSYVLYTHTKRKIYGDGYMIDNYANVIYRINIQLSKLFYITFIVILF